MNDDLLKGLAEIVGHDNLIRDEDLRVLYSQDVYTKTSCASAVLRPGSAEELAQCVTLAAKSKVALLPRGGGMSYTSGYVPETEEAVIVDMARLDAIHEINLEDMYVTVGAGCTWKKLYEELKDTGFCTPYWGTLSGRYATVGGGVSQGAVFWGSGRYGTSVESVLGLEVVLGDGTILLTGSGAHPNGSPFSRYFGPDLTGLFLGDTGALGFKTKVTLRLMKQRQCRRFLSFDAPDAPTATRFITEVSRGELATEVFGFDPYLQSQRMKRDSLTNDIKSLAGVIKAGGLKEGLKVAAAGRRFMKNTAYSVHLIVEEELDVVADHREKALRQLAKKFGLSEIENSIPKIMRANPFGPVNTMIGPEGERWVPVHALVPHSKAEQVFAAAQGVEERFADEVKKFDIGIGYLYSSVSNTTFLLEPVFFYPDALAEMHHHAVEDDIIRKVKGFPANPEARDAVQRMRQAMMEVFRELGAIHLQIGRAYPYQRAVSAEYWSLLERIKQQLDPSQVINPGSLGLSAGAEK